jgi:hypothetical protein
MSFVNDNKAQPTLEHWIEPDTSENLIVEQGFWALFFFQKGSPVSFICSL